MRIVIPRIHGCWDGLIVEAERHGWLISTAPLPVLFVGPYQINGRFARYLLHLVNHIYTFTGLAFRGGNKRILQREFITLPTLICFPIWAPLRKRIWLLDNHNLSYARRRILDRWAIRLLLRLGAQFATIEKPTYKEFLGLRRCDKGIVFPFPLVLRRRPLQMIGSEYRLGLVGNLREEQGAREAISWIREFAERNSTRMRIVGISANIRALEELSGLFDETIDSREAAVYWNAIESLDCIVLNYDRRKYALRPSGIAGDAISCGVLVVGPDTPVIRSQIMEPTPYGAVFSEKSDFGTALSKALLQRTRLEECLVAQNAHIEYRGAKAIGRVFALAEMSDYKTAIKS